ncbi:MULTISPECIES: SseB family protein [Microbacterium]|uniref:SseB family protein n=1 Tax=Microbacterium TaxID=33882 RepID=UPI00217E7AA7|nr:MULTISPECIES: SseB family protein [Microbacterium]UWF77939.1 SseB family protein [Microbacterium neungamense]WCM56116.1 SseB family protein [Microbacterium sp. EF45047]
MALFSRRKKPADTAVEPLAEEAVETEASGPPDRADSAAAETAPAEPVPEVNITVQAFRGVGAEAGPEVRLPEQPASDTSVAAGASGTTAQTAPPASAPTAPTASAAANTPQAPPKLPLAPAQPPAQTRTVEGLNDNVLLREALAQLEEGATNEQLLGVLRQSLQGHLYLRVHGDARQQISEGKPLSVGVVRDGERSFMLAYSSGAALRASVQGDAEAANTSAIAQPVTSVYQQVVKGGFTGLIIDNSSAPHRAVFPTELLQKTLEQGDEQMTLKTVLAAPRQPDSVSRVAEALARSRTWVAVNDGANGQAVGIAEARTADGRRYLQVFSHPLEVVALGRGDRPMPFAPEQLAKVLRSHEEIAGVIVDVAGPSIAVDRDALAPLLVLAVDVGD